MSKSTTDSQWVLRTSVRWHLKPELQLNIPCSNCKGAGGFRGGFGCMEHDEWNDCSECKGVGSFRNKDIKPKPEIPKRFLLMLKKAVQRFKD